MNGHNYINKLFQILLTVTLSLFIIFSAVKLTLMFKPLYYFDIDYLNIEKESNFGRDEIIKNYDYVIDYLLIQRKKNLSYHQFHIQNMEQYILRMLRDFLQPLIIF